MSLGLDALKRARRQGGDIAGAGGRGSIFATKDRKSRSSARTAIDTNGDTTLTDYGLYVIKKGLPTFDQEDHAGGGAEVANK